MTEKQPPPDLEVDFGFPEGLKVTADSPYRILVVSDLAGSDAGTLSGPLSSGVVNVTADSFDKILQVANPSLSFSLADPIGTGGGMVAVDLSFDSIRAFDPAQVAARLNGTAALVTVRARIVERMQSECSAEALSTQITTAISNDENLGWLTESLNVRPAPLTDETAVDDVLGQLDLGDDDSSPPPPQKSPIGKAVAAAAGQGEVPPEEISTLRRTLGEIDRRVSAWLSAVLHAPQFRKIEAKWRSLAWLVSNIESRKGVRLSILHAPHPSLMERFIDSLIDPVFDEGVPAPHLIVVDSSFGNGANDAELIDEFAQHAASLPSVVLVGLSHSFFGVKHAWQVPTLPALVNMFDTWQFAKWKSLREKPYARNLGAVFGRILLRPIHGREEVPELGFSFREACVGENDLLWGSGVFAAAYTVGRSMTSSGWPCGVSGRLHGRIEGLPRAKGGKTGDKWYGPADTSTKQARVEEMGYAGINAVVIAEGQEDDAVVSNGMTAARQTKADMNATLEVSLPYQLFAGRLSALLFDLKPHLEGRSGDAMVAMVRSHMRDWLRIKEEPTEEQVSAQVREDERQPGSLLLAVTVTPPPEILPAGIPVVMGYTVKGPC
jgi:type VI secretion system protein ImpC